MIRATLLVAIERPAIVLAPCQYGKSDQLTEYRIEYRFYYKHVHCVCVSCL